MCDLTSVEFRNKSILNFNFPKKFSFRFKLLTTCLEFVIFF